ncbi:MAG: efflux RND transporter permease subunit [Candidatus Hydrogenedentes bacterium]|nr:efflux RND transporter permease subunit [Candidatus Hydrogenedentota bacterium]
MNFSLPAFALRHPVSVMMLAVTMLGLGAIAWVRLPLTFLPRAEAPFVLVIFPYPGAVPEQVEQQIAVPVEGEFRTIPGLSRIETTSHSNGCTVELVFGVEADMTVVTGEIRDRIERLKLVLPKEVDRVQMKRFSIDSVPVMVIGMFNPGDREEFAHLVRKVAEPRLRRLPGVARVEVHSPTAPREVLIEFEQDTLRSLNIALPDIISRISEGSMNLTLGDLTDSTTRYYARYEGEYRSIEDIAAIVVGPNSLRLGDVATVSFSAREETQRVTLDGTDGLILLVTKESQANTVSVCKAVRKELDRLVETPTFRNTRVLPLFDQSEFIIKALKNLFLEGLFGAAMAIATLMIFIHRIVPTALVAFSIPTSLVFALVFMFFSGMTLNIITMVSMIISVGMLVDNSIVVVENILRHRSLGMPIREALVKGPQEVYLAIIASTATTCVVFLPMFYMQAGQMSVFMKQLGGPLVAALGGSLVVALTLIPLILGMLEHRAERGGKKRQEDKPNRLLTWAGNAVDGVVGVYGTLLRASLRWRFVFISVILLVIFLTARFPMKEVGMRSLPKLDMREVTVGVNLSSNYGMEGATTLFKRLEEELALLRETLGIKYLLSRHGRDEGEIHVYLYTEDDGPRGTNPPFTTDEVMKILSQKLPAQVPGARVNLFTADVGDPGAERGVRLMLRGDDTQVLDTYARSIAESMAGIESLRDIKIGVEQPSQEVQVIIDAPLAHRAGVTPMVIAQTVDAALRGVRMPYLKLGGREIPVWAQFREEDRQSQANLDTIAVPGLFGQLTPLNQLTDYAKAPAPSRIKRINGKNVVSVSARTDTRNLIAVKEELRELMDSIDLPPMYEFLFGDEFDELEKNLANFTVTMLMAVVLIYLVMCALFESFILPFSIMTTVPLAGIGAVWLLYFTSTPFDSISLIGCILMAGVIVNNGIVIVDHINHTCREIGNRDEGIIQAGRNRFKPVMMTAITTILGLVPVAMARTGGSATFAGLGRALIGGLMAGTVLTLFVVPIFYVILDDFSAWLKNFLANVKMSPVRKS